jgi:hypothetical protein
VVAHGPAKILALPLSFRSARDRWHSLDPFDPLLSSLFFQPQICPCRVTEVQRRRGRAAIVDAIFVAAVIVTAVEDDLQIQHDVRAGLAKRNTGAGQAALYGCNCCVCSKERVRGQVTFRRIWEVEPPARAQAHLLNTELKFFVTAIQTLILLILPYVVR